MDEDKRPSRGFCRDSSRVSSSLVRAGDRQMFTVELQPGETTIVSWKKLMKDANKVNGSTSVSEPSANAHPCLESRIAPGIPTDNEGKDAPNRFSAVIEKIERLYMGKDSSDDEDLLDAPDDDQYDTEDSFIDDAELDEYFEVDKSTIKHDGFFVNRGKLEHLNDPPVIPNQQQKKRRRKDMMKSHGQNEDGHELNKHIKLGEVESGKTATLPLITSCNSHRNLVVSSEKNEELRHDSKKRSADAKMLLDASLSLKPSNGEASVSVVETKYVDEHKIGVVQSKSLVDKYRDASGTQNASLQRYPEKGAYARDKSQLGQPSSNTDDMENSNRYNGNNISELPDLNLSDGKCSTQAAKRYMPRKDGLIPKPKNATLEKAIRELEKMVAESRPPVGENQEADNTSQAIKRRLPREIKLKLAKVARLAQSNHGKLSKELINRLMSILGHLVQLRTLKRNLKVMISMDLSAKQEKDDRFEHIKHEVVQMIKMQAPSLDSKQQVQTSDDFQETGPDERRGLAKRKFRMDMALEEKICDLYDLFVEDLDEDAGPQIRKLYAELAELWPDGSMDNHGIKRAICRAKERRRALYNKHKDQERMKRKKMLAPRQDEIVRVEANPICQQQSLRERSAHESGNLVFTKVSKHVSNITSSVRVPSPSLNVPNLERVTQEKMKGGSSSSMDDTRAADGTLTKKKVKRKYQLDSDGAHFRPEKIPSQLGEGRQKPLKHFAALPHKSNVQFPGVEQSS